MDVVGQQALLNEYKGNLFEYLVALKLAQSCNLETNFLNSVSDDVRHMLRIQESYIRGNFPHLLQDLPVLASEMVSKLLPLLEVKKITSINMIGKVFASQNRFAEADLIIAQGGDIPISIKLSKAKAYVNTKSGGIKSFLTKYFPGELSKKLQQELNNFVDEKFHQMAFNLHEVAGLDYDMNFDEWVAQGMTELPGKLAPELREVVHQLYYTLLQKLHESMQAIRKSDSTIFTKGLLPLIGLGNENLIQATCFYNRSNEHYVLDEILIEKASDIYSEVLSNQLGDFREGLANFEILLPKRILQVRIKPMNKFTAASFKVNCSVKKLT